MSRKNFVPLAALLGMLVLTTTSVGSSGSSGFDAFPNCSPPPVPQSVSLVMKGPCKIADGQATKYVLVLTNGTKKKLTSARMTFARKSFIVKAGMPYVDENPENPDSRVDWTYRNIPPKASRSVTIWLKFRQFRGQTETSYILWLQASPTGLRQISRSWYPSLVFK